MVIYDRPEGVPFDLVGYGSIGQLDYEASSTTAGNEHTVSVTSQQSLGDAVGVLNESMVWAAKLKTDGQLSGHCNMGNSGAHVIYVTWGTPTGSEPTIKRIRWVCTTASGEETKEGCIDKIWDAVVDETQFSYYEPQVDGWSLLDGGAGDCDNQARCMKYAVEMLGAGPAVVRLVRASTDRDCLDHESRYCSVHQREEELNFLCGGMVNFFEGCCVTGNHYYAITPQLKCHDDYEILLALRDRGCTQWWMYWEERDKKWYFCSEQPFP